MIKAAEAGESLAMFGLHLEGELFGATTCGAISKEKKPFKSARRKRLRTRNTTLCQLMKIN